MHTYYKPPHRCGMSRNQGTSEHSTPLRHRYDLAWTFPRSFHVSPFNSRNGYYRLDTTDPFLQPSPSPRIKILLRLLTPDREPKLQALLASNPSRDAIMLDATNSWKIYSTLLRWPLALLLTTPRIMYQAYILHYEKKLAVYPRPEPKSQDSSEGWNAPEEDMDRVGSAVGWQQAGWGERKAREAVESFLRWSDRMTRVSD